MITYYKSQLEVSVALKDIIDKYWKLELDEERFIALIRQIVDNNQELIFKDDEYTSIIKLKLGVKRLGLLDKILDRKKKGDR